MADASVARQGDTYTPGYSERVQSRLGQRTGDEHAAFFLPHLRPGMRLLDVGSGPGSITLDLAAVVAPGEVIGIDIEPHQVERAQAFAREQQVPNVRFEVGDAHALPFPDASFGAVYANAVLMHVRDPLAVLREFRRVLRGGGVAGISDIAGLSVREPATPLLEELAIITERARDHQRGRPQSVLDFQQRRLMLDAGFARTEGQVRAENFGTSESVRHVAQFRAGQIDERLRPTILAEGWADAAKLDAMVAELRAWAERPDSFGCSIWCAAVGWVDGDAATSGT